MNINYIKRYLQHRLGDRIIVIYYGSRNRRERYEGILYRLYNNIFVVKLASGEIKSFVYIDIITKTIQIYI